MRKKIGRTGICAAAVLILALLAVTFRNFAVTPHIVIGPYKTFALVGLTILLSGSLSLYCFNITKARVIGWSMFALGCLIPAGLSLLNHRGLLPQLNRFFERFFVIIPILIFCGICLWASSLPHMPLYRISFKSQLLIILAITAVTLLPMLRTGYCWDDAFFSVDIPSMRLTGASILERTFGEIVSYCSNGRINPFATFQFLIFYLVPNETLYKVLLWAMTILDVWFFYRFIFMFTRSRKTASGSALILSLCFQLRTYHDALSGYYGLMQIMFLEMMVSLIAFICFLRTGKMKDRIICILFFILPLLSYEMFYPMILLYIVIAWIDRKSLKKAVRACLPLIVILVVMFGATLILRGRSSGAEEGYNGTAFSPEPLPILRTFLYQVFAAFPLSYQHAGNDAALFGKLIPFNTVFTTNLGDFLRNIRWEDVLAVIFGMFMIGELSREDSDAFGRNLSIGVLLLGLPGIVISLSEKYQQDLRLGLAYIPVFFQYFGAAFILCEIVAGCRKTLGRRETASLCMGLFAAIFALNQQNNRAVTEYLNQGFRYPRIEGERALQSGILGSEFGEDKTLICDNPYYPWEDGWGASSLTQFYGLNAGFPLHAVSSREFAAGYEDGEFILPENASIISYTGDKDKGFTGLARVRSTVADPEGPGLALTMVTDLFIHVKGASADAELIYETREGEIRRLPLSEAWLISDEPDGTLYKIMENTVLNFESITVRL